MYYCKYKEQPSKERYIPHYAFRKTKAVVYFGRRHVQMHQIDNEEFNRMMKTSTLIIRTLPPTASQLYFAAAISFSQYL